MNKRKISVQKTAYTALLIALEVVLSRFCSINTAGWKIGFSFVPITAAAALFGSFTAGIVYGAADFIGAILFPIGTYHPGFTVSAVLMGLVWGFFLYDPDDGEGSLFRKRDRVKMFPNIVIPSLINSLAIGLLLNTLWVSMLYGSRTYVGWLIYRLPEYMLMIPANILIVPGILKLCRRVRPIMYVHRRKSDK